MTKDQAVAVAALRRAAEMSADAANALAAFNGDARSDDADDFRRNAAILRALADAIEQAQTGWQYKSAVTLGTPDGLPDEKRVWIIPAPRLKP